MACKSKNCTDVQTSCTNSQGEDLGTTSADALACNSSTIDQIVNGFSTVTNRIGNQLNSIAQLETNYIITPINGGIWAAGQTFTAYNQFMGFAGISYKPKLSTALPYVVGASPIGDGNVEPFSDLTASEADIRYDRRFTTEVEAVAAIDIIEGQFVQIGDRDNGIFKVVLTSGVTPNPYNIIISVGESTLSFFLTEGDIHSALAWGIKKDGSDQNVAMQFAVDALILGQTLEFESGIYHGWFNIRTSGVSVVSKGGDVTIKIPNGASHTVDIEGGGTDTGVPIGIDIGNTPLGNSATAVTGINVIGFVVDGNRGSTASPTSDLFGWGVTMTKASKCNVNVKGVSCWQGGVGVFINSNYNFINAYAEDSGFSPQTPSSIDLNSSNFNVVNGISKDCNFGGRILDNCTGNIFDIAIDNPVLSGFILSNQLINEGCFNNTVRISVNGGVSNDAMQVAGRCYSNDITLSSKGVSGGCLHIVSIGVSEVTNLATNYTCIRDHISDSTNEPGVGASWPTFWVASGISGTPWLTSAAYKINNNSRGNEFTVNSYESDLYSVKCDGDNNKITINSMRDGRSGGVGAQHAMTCAGKNNIFNMNIVDGDVSQVRGWFMESTAEDNEIISVSYDNVVSFFTDDGMSTLVDYGGGFGSNIASAANIIIPIKGDIFLVTGVTDISSITAISKRTITLVFSSALTVFTGVNIKLSSNFVTAADSTLALICDGTDWFEISRSINI